MSHSQKPRTETNRGDERGQFRTRAMVTRNVGEPKELKIPNRTVTPDMAHGVYANNVDSIQTESEVILDFTFVHPISWSAGADSKTIEKLLRNETVARVIIPPHRFESFVLTYIQSRPELIRYLLEQPTEVFEVGEEQEL
jgi:hypothetical protein